MPPIKSFGERIADALVEDGLLTMKLILPDRGYPDDSARRQFVTRTIEAFRQVAGVEQVAAINNMPSALPVPSAAPTRISLIQAARTDAPTRLPTARPTLHCGPSCPCSTSLTVTLLK